MVQAAGLTMAVFLGLTLFTFQTKIDFSFLVSAAAYFCLCVCTRSTATDGSVSAEKAMDRIHHVNRRSSKVYYFLFSEG